MIAAGKHYIDGVDLWTTLGITIEKGSYNDLIKLPARKETIEHNWKDEDGLDKDLSRTFYEAREITLNCFIKATSDTEFWTNWQNFLALLGQPGVRRLSVTELGREFYVFYKQSPTFDKITRYKDSTKIASKFVLSLVEQRPGFNTVPTFIIDESNRFLIT